MDLNGKTSAVCAASAASAVRLVRRVDWRERLAGFLQARARQPFVWGRQDCALFACDAVEVMTGVDVAAPLRGYGSFVGAQRKMLEYLRRPGETAAQVVTGKSLLELVAEQLAGEWGAPEVKREPGGHWGESETRRQEPPGWESSLLCGDVVLVRRVTTDREFGCRIGVSLGVVDVDGASVVAAGTWGLVRTSDASCVLRAWRI